MVPKGYMQGTKAPQVVAPVQPTLVKLGAWSDDLATAAQQGWWRGIILLLTLFCRAF